MIIARKIAYNVLVSSISKILSTILALVSIGFITRYLGKTGFGDYATVLAFFAFFAAVLDLGIYSISTREISREGAPKEKIMGNIVSLRIISSLVVFFLSPLLVSFFPYSPEVKQAIIVVAAAFVFSSAYQVLNGVFQKNLAMDRVAIAELGGKVIQLGTIILAIKLNLGFSWIIASVLFYMIFAAVLIYILSRKYIIITLQFDWKYWKKFLKESYPLGIAVFISFIYFKMDTILLSILRDSADVGIYNAAYKVIENITFFPSMMVGLVFPIMSQNIFTNKKRFLEISNKTLKVFVLLITPLVIGTLFLSEGVIALIGGAGFLESANVLRILVFALVFIFLGNFFNAILVAGNYQKKLMLVLLAAASVNLVANFFLIPLYSYWGASFISVLTELIVASGTGFLAYYYVKYVPQVENFGSIILSGAIMVIFLLFSFRYNFFLVGTGSVFVYIFSLWLTKAVRTEEITSIISRKNINSYDEVLP